MDSLTRRIVLAGAFGAAVACALPVASANAATMRVALGDLPGIESIQTLAAIERAKERGVDIDLIVLNDEDLAAQAIVSGQADVGIGAPYTLIQKVGVPIRMFAQISTLRFFPVVNTEFYKSWQDLDGEPVVVHARGSGTEAIMMLMAERNGIEYSEVSYVPGSEVRRGAMLQGTIKASIVDAANRAILLKEAPDRFMVLPLGDIKATDEALFATSDYLAANAADAQVLVEELMKTAREITDDPSVAVDYRNKYNLLPDLGDEADQEILDYYTETAEAGALPLNAGSPEAVQDDFDFFTIAGQIEGDSASLKVEDFWDFTIADQATEKLGKQ